MRLASTGAAFRLVSFGQASCQREGESMDFRTMGTVIKRAAVVVLAGLAGAGCGGPRRATSGETTQRAGALSPVTPTLAAHSGLLCFTETPTTTNGAATFSAPDANGWVNITRPQARAVLGGTGGDPSVLIATNLDFQITGQATDWNADIYGPRPQVCALISGRDPCNQTQICWRADGRLFLEQKGNSGVETYAECGENGTYVVVPYATNRLATSPLTQGHTYTMRSTVSSDEIGREYTAVAFLVDGQQVMSIEPYLLWNLEAGFSGFVINRLTAKVRISGQSAAGGTIAATAVATEGDTLPDGTLSCSYYAQQRRKPIAPWNPYPFAAAAAASGQNPITVGIAFTNPDGVPFSSLSIFRDGYRRRLSAECPGSLCFGYDDYQNYPDATYAYEVGWTDSVGVPSILRAFDVHTPPPPSRPAAFHNGQYKVGVVLARFSDAPGTPFSRDQVSSWMFGGPGTTSVAEYYRRASLGQMTFTGTVFDWVNLPFPIQPTCTKRIPFTTLFPLSDPDGSLTALGAGYGCELDDSTLTALETTLANGQTYDHWIYLINGLGAAGIDGQTRTMLAGTYYPLTMSDLLHELGHSFGLEHSGDWLCGGGGAVGVGPDLATYEGAGCQPSRYGTYDPMGVATSLYNADNLYRMGWFGADAVVQPQSGLTYTIEKWDAATNVTRMLRIPLQKSAFYFVEYRGSGGADGFASCAGQTCSPRTLNAPDASTLPGVMVWLTMDAQDWKGQYLFSDDSDLRPTDPIPAGGSFVDPYRGVTVKVLSTDANSATVQVMTCGDGVKNGTETGIDCGGSCPGCPYNQGCLSDADCAARRCSLGFCISP
jgi:hypothetical protein